MVKGLALAIVVFGNGCFAPVPPVGTMCIESDACPESHVCLEQACVDPTTIGCVGVRGGNHDATVVTRRGLSTADQAHIGRLDASWFNLAALEGSWHFDDAIGPIVSGTALEDSSPHGRNVVVNSRANADVMLVPSKLGVGLAFDGVDDRIEIPASAAWNFENSPGSIALWFRTQGRDQSRVDILDHQNWFLYVDARDAPASGRLFFSPTQDRLGSVRRVDDGQWHHVVVTLEGAPVTARLYLDGIDQGSRSFPLFEDSDELIWIGGQDEARGFPGQIDEVSIWSRVLSATEILALYDRQRSAVRASFESALCDAGSTHAWSELLVVPQGHYGKALPLGVEQGYDEGGWSHVDYVSLWRFDGQVGMIDAQSTVADASSLSHTAQASDASLHFVDGLFGQAVRFPRSGGHLEVANTSMISFAGSFTLSTWLRRQRAPHRGSILARTDGMTPPDVELYVCGEDDVCAASPDAIVFAMTGVVTTRLISDRGISDIGRWHHVVVTRVGDSVTMYLDGVVVAAAEGVEVVADSALPIVIGGHGGVGLGGDVDETMLLGDAISEADVAALYQRGALSVRYQVRVCNDPACPEAVFSGPSGPASYYGDTVDTVYPLLFDVSHVESARYFQWRAELTSAERAMVPIIRDARIALTR